MGNKEKGIKRTKDGGIFCEKCGNDLNKEGSARFSMHIDGRDFWENQFICLNCGAVISQRHTRDAEDAAWWAED